MSAFMAAPNCRLRMHRNSASANEWGEPVIGRREAQRRDACLGLDRRGVADPVLYKRQPKADARGIVTRRAETEKDELGPGALAHKARSVGDAPSPQRLASRLLVFSLELRFGERLHRYSRLDAMFRTENNHLHFIGNTGGDVLPITAALHNLIHKQGYSDITLNFSKAGYLDAKLMLPLVTMARFYRLRNVDFDIIEPEEVKSQRLLQNTNWAHLIDPGKYDARDDRNQLHLSAIQYATADDQFRAVDRSMDVILKNLNGLDRSRLKALEWSLNEITDNVLNHADSPIGGIVQVMTFPKKQLVEFYVCDSGVSIPRSLRQAKPQIATDSVALRQAIEEGVTRNSQTNQGNGLFGTFKCCQVSGGEFYVLSGNVSLSHRPGEINTSTNSIPFHGTFVRAAINYGFEQLLEKALIFKGKPHNPAGDYIERVYQAAGEEVTFRVNTELSTFGSREAGKIARTKIENLMDKGSTAIIFDFMDLHLISSSFADEVFGRLFVELGPIKFSQLCKFTNVDPTVQTLIDRAITQRMKV